MQFLMGCFVFVVSTGFATTGLAQPSSLDLYREGAAAYAEADYATFLDRTQRALELEPGQPLLVRDVARGHARLGDSEAAFEWLKQVLRLGVSLPLESYEDFDLLQEDPRWKSLMTAVTLTRRSQGEPLAMVQADDAGLIPEGIAYDAQDDVFYLTSVARRNIVRMQRDGSLDEFIAGDQHGFLCGLGVRVDAERRHLWAVSAAFPESPEYSEGDVGRSAVHQFDLKTGELIRRFDWTSAGPPASSFNDLVIRSDGTVIVTDAGVGALYSIAPGAQELEEFVAPGSIRGANGLAFNDDESTLYVARYVFGIDCVDMTTREVTRLRHANDVSTAGVDGLYYVDGSLLAVQNYLGLDRVARFHLNETGTAVDRHDVVIARHEMFDDPTTGVVVGDRFHFIANSQVVTYLADCAKQKEVSANEGGEDKKETPPAQYAPAAIFEVKY